VILFNIRKLQLQCGFFLLDTTLFCVNIYFSNIGEAHRNGLQQAEDTFR